MQWYWADDWRLPETDAVPDGMRAADGTAYPEHSGDYGLLNGEGKHTGYNWISYYDQSLTGPVTMAFTDDGDGERTGILQYDYLISSPLTPYWKESGEPMSAANMFTADRDMELTGVSARTFFGESRVAFTIVKMGENAENPEDSEQMIRIAETFPYPEYHRTELPKPIPLKKGEVYTAECMTNIDTEGMRRKTVKMADKELQVFYQDQHYVIVWQGKDVYYVVQTWNMREAEALTTALSVQPKKARSE